MYSFEHSPLGTGGALRNAIDLVSGADILAMNGDSFCDIDLLALSEAHRTYGGAATLAALPQNDRRRAGTVKTDDNGRIVEFESRPAVPTPGLINAGIYMLRRDVVQSIPTEANISLEDNIFPHLVDRGALYAWQVEGRFIDYPIYYRAKKKLGLYNALKGIS